jgi:hypothetical protein
MQWFAASVKVSLIAVTKVDGSDRTCPIDVKKQLRSGVAVLSSDPCGFAV